MCCSSILPLVKFIYEPVQNIWTGTKCFNLGQLLLLFLRQKISLAPSIFSSSSLFSSSPLYLPHLLFHPSCPNIPAPILFTSMLTLWALRPLVFLWIRVLMPYQWAMGTWMQVPLFFNYIYTVLVIHFFKLFKSDMYVGPSPSQS